MGGRSAVAPAIAIWVGLCAGPSLSTAAIFVWVGVVVALSALAMRAGPRFATVLLCVACFGSASARGAAQSQRWRRAEADLVLDLGARWVRGVVVDHPWLESGEPAAIVQVLAAERAPRLSGTRVRLWLAVWWLGHAPARPARSCISASRARCLLSCAPPEPSGCSLGRGREIARSIQRKRWPPSPRSRWRSRRAGPRTWAFSSRARPRWD